MDIDPKYDHYDFPTQAAEPKNGHAGHLTQEQIAMVHQLRMMLESEGYTDRLDTLTLLRFLRARKWDVNLSKKMFVECENWRKKTQLDEILPTWDYPEKAEISKYYKQYYHKTDKLGRPIYIETYGGIDMYKMRQITTEDRMLMNLAVEYERVADPRLPACSRKAGSLLETCCTIMDLKGVGLGSIMDVKNYLQLASSLSQNYYPERLGKLYVINSPMGFWTAWRLIKGWLDPVTVSKIEVPSSSELKGKLLEMISPENLPKEYGGICECPGGCMNSDAGPWRDPEWARPAKWEKDNVIENKGSEIEVPDAEPVPEKDGLTQPAPAAA